VTFQGYNDKTIVAYFVEYTVEKFEKFLIIAILFIFPLMFKTVKYDENFEML
jgi:hypothetical protein